MPLLRIDIEARVAQFQDAMTSIERSAKKSAGSISSAFSGANAALAGLGVGISVGGLAAIVKSAIDAADHLNDLSKKTGVAVEVLGGIGFAASQAGADLDSVAKAMGKFNLQIADAGAGGKESAAAFRALGIEIKDSSGNLRSADSLLVDVAGRFEGLAEGPEKARLANQLFTKSYADLLPLLDDGAESLRKNIEYFRQYSGVTQDVAEKSDRFNDTLAKIKLISGAAGSQIAAELLPTLQKLADYLLEVKESSEGFGSVGKAIATVVQGVSVLGINTVYTFKAIGTEIGGVAAQLGRLAHLDFKGFQEIGEQMKIAAEKARKEVDEQTARILNPEAAPSGDQPSKPKPKPRAPIVAGSSVDDAAKRVLEGKLREFERLSDQEKTLLATRREFLQTYYQQDLLSINDYYQARQAAADEALQAQALNIDKQIALLEKRRLKDDSERASNDSKVMELREKRAQLEQQANLEATKGEIERAAAARAFAAQLTDINQRLLEQQGFFEKAAGANFDQQTSQLRARLATELESANTSGNAGRALQLEGFQKKLNMLRDMAVAQGRLNELQGVESRIQSDLTIATSRAEVAAKTGAVTELQALRQVSDARAQAAIDVAAVAEAFAEAAEKSADPRFIQRANEMRQQAAELAANADLVRDKFQDVFENGFESFFDKLVSGTLSLKSAFKSLFAEIASDLSKIAIKDFGEQLFKKKGAFGGLVDFASQLFGGESKTPSTAAGLAGLASESAARTAAIASITSMTAVTTAADASMVAFATTTVAADTALITLSTSAAAASAALAAVAASSAGGAASKGFEGFIGMFGDFASTAANGNIYAAGNVIPFARGGVPGIVDAPTFFAMAGGRTGLMGEAGAEAIMPLQRDKYGGLAVSMVGKDGQSVLLPLTRDRSGRLAVRTPDDGAREFAKGGAFSKGILTPTFSTNAASALSNQPGIRGAAISSPMAPVQQAVMGDTYIEVNVPAGTSRESASSIANRTAMVIARANRRNG